MQSPIKRLSLSVLSCVLLTLNVSCLKVTEEEKTPDAGITSFVVGYYNVRFHDVNVQRRDTIVYNREGGVMYPMTIDQINNRIYNIDSLAYGSVLDSVTCSIGYKGVVTYRYDDDGSVYDWNSYEALDFTRPLSFIVTSTDGSYVRTYDFKLNVCSVFPDSMLWINADSAGFTKLDGPCAVVSGDTLYDFGTDSEGALKVARRNVSKGVWSVAAVSGLPVSGWSHSVVALKDSLYSVSGGNLYVSRNGTDWKVSRSGISAIIPSVNRNDCIWAVTTSDDIVRTTDMKQWTTVQKKPQGFADSVAVAVVSPLETNPKITRTILIGNKAGENYSRIWTMLSTDTELTQIDFPVNEDLRLPVYKTLSVIWYDEVLFAFGRGLDGFRQSTDNGLTWYYCDRYADETSSWNRYMQLPEAIKGVNSGFSYATDSLGGLWIMTSDGQVWRGAITRLNKRR